MKKIIVLSFLTLVLSYPAHLKAQEPDTLIVQALAMISADSLHSYVQQMQDMQTRFMIAPNRRDVATWVMNKYLSFGVPEVRLDSFQCYTNLHIFGFDYDTLTWQYNVEARVEGSEVPDEEVVLIGHFDDFSMNDPENFAPGADDNASGTAASLETARVIMEMGYEPRQTLIFLSSAAEELMYYGDAGTEHYAAEAQEEGRNIVMAINNDMIGWDDGSWTVDLFNHIGSPEITDLAIWIITTYTSLNYDSSDPVYQVGGDIQPFLDAGYHGIYFMENYISPNYHSDQDVVDSCSMSYLTETTKVSLGCILHADLTVGQEEMIPGQPVIRIYPNPSYGELNLQLNRSKEASTLQIFNATGKETYHSGLSDGINFIDLKESPPGIYLLVVRTGLSTFSRKIILVKRS